jgi:hypothetical protein
MLRGAGLGSRTDTMSVHPAGGIAGSYAKKFFGKYADRIVKGGVGHNLPQEDPRALAEAIVEVAEI